MTNERLSSSEACSDKAIAVVTMLAIYQRIHHQQAIGLVHFNGLRRMVDLRGGLAKLSSENRALAQKPWRLALEFAVQDGSAPAFSLDDILSIDDNPAHLNGLLKNSRTINLPIDATLRAQLTSISSFTHHLNTTHTKLDPHDYSDAVCSRLHHLLHYTPLKSNIIGPLDNLVYGTLLSIMTTLLPEYGHRQAQYDVLAGRLRDALRNYAAIRTKTNGEVLLWAVFVEYVTVLGSQKDEEWLVSLGSQSCQQLGIHDRIGTHTILCRYGWINAFYDKAGLKLLKRIAGTAGG